MVTTIISTFERGTATGVASMGFVAMLIIWVFVNFKESPNQASLYSKVTVFILPLFIMFVYMMFIRHLRIILG